MSLRSQVAADVSKKVRKAAEPYSISAKIAHQQQPSALFLLPPQLRILQHSDEEAGNVWVKGEDILDILMLAGVAASENSVDAAIDKLRNFLPGILTGKFCLHVSFVETLIMIVTSFTSF